MARAVWYCYTAHGRRIDRAATRTAAMNKLHKPHYWPGRVRVRHSNTGETWERRKGSWFRIGILAQAELDV